MKVDLADICLQSDLEHREGDGASDYRYQDNISSVCSSQHRALFHVAATASPPRKTIPPFFKRPL